MNQEEFRLIVNQVEEEAAIESGIPIKRDNDYLELGHDIWKEYPVSFNEFVESDLHLNHPALTSRQYKDVLKLLGSDPQEVFRDNPDYNVGVLLWGKGSGKDLVASCMQAYLVYVLLCMRSPQEYFQFPISEPIDIVNVAYNAREAKEVFFAKFKERIKNWRWLREHYMIIEGGRPLNKYVKGTTQYVRIGENNIKFPHLIRANSEHSQASSYEGYNILCLSGETKIKLVDGRSVSIKELEGQTNFLVYSYDKEKQQIASGNVTKVFKTQQDALVYKVNFSKGKSVKCTGDHLFLMRDGSYKKAKDFQFNDSLMPFYYQINSRTKGYEWLYLPEPAKWWSTQEQYHKRFATRVGSSLSLETRKKISESLKRNRYNNHKVVSVEFAGYADVYDMSVEKYHNFALDCGVFAHNCWVMDEASAFMDAGKHSNATLVYSTLLTSSETRFGTRAKGLILSFPRSKNDFTVRMYEKAIKGDATDSGGKLFGSKGFSWEIKPSRFFCGTTFEYKGHNIPVELKSSFDQFPEEAECRHLCSPGEEIDSFIKFPERVDDAVIDKEPIFVTETQIFEHNIKGTIKRFVGKKIIAWKDLTLAEKRLPRVIHVDNGVDVCDAALVIGHGEDLFMTAIHADGRGIDEIENDETSLIDPKSLIAEGEFVPTRKTIIDAIEIWVPDKRRQLQVSLLSVDSMLEDICNVLNIVAISYDQWESAKSIEYFLTLGYVIEKHTITYEDFRQVRTCLYVNALELPYYPLSLKDRDTSLAVEEFKHLRSLGGKRIEKGEGYSKDVADCIAGVVRHVNSKSYKGRSAPSRAIKGSLVLSGKTVDQFGAPDAQIVISTKPKLARLPSSRRPRPRLSNSLLNRKR